MAPKNGTNLDLSPAAACRALATMLASLIQIKASTAETAESVEITKRGPDFIRMLSITGDSWKSWMGGL